MTALPLLDVNGVWHQTYFIGLSFIAFIFCCKHANYVGTPFTLLWLWAIARTMFIVFWPSAHYGPYTHSFQVTAAQVLVELLLIPYFAIKVKRSVMVKVATFFAFYSIACVWFGYKGLMNSPSFNTALAALCVPLISPWLGIAVVITALTHHGTTALLILLAMLITQVMKRRVPMKYVAGAGFAALASAKYFQVQPHFNSGERIHHWIEYVTYWLGSWKSMIVGIGPGSFVWWSYMNHPYQTGLYLQMHNDYLEVLWGLGLIGGVLAAWGIVEAVGRAWKKPVVLAGLIGSLVCMATYEPITYFPTAILMAYYFAESA